MSTLGTKRMWCFLCHGVLQPKFVRLARVGIMVPVWDCPACNSRNISDIAIVAKYEAQREAQRGGPKLGVNRTTYEDILPRLLLEDGVTLD